MVIDAGIYNLEHLLKGVGYSDLKNSLDLEELKRKKKQLGFLRSFTICLFPLSALIFAYLLISSSSNIHIFCGYILISSIICAMCLAGLIASCHSNKSFWEPVFRTVKLRKEAAERKSSSSGQCSSRRSKNKSAARQSSIIESSSNDKVPHTSDELKLVENEKGINIAFFKRNAVYHMSPHRKKFSVFFL